ncbi:DUF1707 domain-containing protein [Streptomyces sp. DSM 44915]|uniref:DUF1707 domain-containing protein n=1 Tax=Streptomyces chisholmiae TaxID=3075540 RepID=A0ABU2JUT4_9ACTN|nr:DUF1707 domain-containing protein [Streptomyces sp. DSM 44915]MDT0268752.1 DUF1707 domain-containing protein [Streptomyces sp. DSM 44915]
MSRDLSRLRASHEDRDRAVETLRLAGGDGRLSAEELEVRVERALLARTQGELAALVGDVPVERAPGDRLVVEQRGGRWSRAGRWVVPSHIEVRTEMCRVVLDFTEAVLTSRTLRIDADLRFGRLVLVGAPDIVLETDGLNLVFSKVKRRPAGAVSDPRLRVELVGTLTHAKVVERRP